jgi:hypothetical protein
MGDGMRECTGMSIRCTSEYKLISIISRVTAFATVTVGSLQLCEEAVQGRECAASHCDENP